MSYVRIENINKSYQQQKVLNDISFSIEEGQFLTLLGPSGCGKSTLLRAIAGLNEIDSGSISVGDRNITALPSKERQIGMVFQSYALFPNMTVFENIAFGLKMDKMKKSEYTPLVEEMIALIDLKGKENRYPAQLSGGQQQRVALARSLVKRPKVLLLDEPLSALDAQIRRSLRTEIRLLQKRLKMTTIFVTHDQEEALTVSDRIIIMNQGRIEQEGSPEDIYTHPASEFVARFIGSYNVLKRSDIGLDSLPDTELFAVRPEVISIAPLAEAPVAELGTATIEGKVEQLYILGNVIRFTVSAGGLDILVDALNNSTVHRIQEGMDVRLFLPADKCEPLRQ
ncbi:ABC transporter ATP-binding protein [Paenibacillus caui]|uniref:ABC transporter ATP-binding protein n=1 Tax=Paenibacillus caui TaxID=2873927 RepID=UPI001CA84A64|nr:ABC transporter ATP-binding protein [Paenibacillus caui]